MMPLTRVLSLLVLLTTAFHQGAAAQGELGRFLPIDVGDEWVYEEFQSSDTLPVSGYVEFRVMGESTVEGARRLHVERQDVALDGTPGELAECTVEPGPGGLLQWVPGSDACSINGHLYRVEQINNVTYPDSVLIGGTYYALGSHGSFASGSSQGGGTTSNSWSYGEGVGFLGYSYTSSRPGQPTSFSGTRLIRATVGGVHYGSLAVTASTEPLPGAFTVETFPNPFVSGSWVSVSGASGPVTVEMFDVTGRRVLMTSLSRGASGFRLALRGAGVYILRATDADGRVGVRRITRL